MAFGRPAKRRKISPPSDYKAVPHTITSKDLFHHAAEWDLEQDYEQQSRLKPKRENTKLPIKTAEGRLEYQVEEPPHNDESDDNLCSIGDASTRDGLDTPTTVESLEARPVALKQQVREAKEELAKIAGLVIGDPEAHAGSFKKAAQFALPTVHSIIRKLALATQLAIYKDLIPGYRIRAYKDEDLGTKVSKDVRQTRQYEQALVTGYQQYVENLASIAKGAANTAESSSEKQVALSCVSALLLSVPHFNFRTELLKTVVGQVSGQRPTPSFAKCVQTLQSFFDADDDGAPSLEAVGLLTKMMKARDYRVQESVLNTFFHLRLLSELSAKSSISKTDKPDETPKYRGKKLKRNWEPRSKKERKIARERKAVEKDVQEADAIVSHETRDRMQSETLKMVFATYFRILKLRIGHLTGVVLEGLAKFAHLINQDFFGDLLEALKDIIHQASVIDSEAFESEADVVRNPTRESLLSTQTAFTLLSGQDALKSSSALHLDLSFFTSYVYQTLYQHSLDPDIELGQKDLPLPVSDISSGTITTQQAPKEVNVLTPMLLLMRVLTSILLNPLSPAPTGTALSFYKRLLTSSLQLPEKSLLALLSLMVKVAQRHGRKIEALWYSDERKGDGVFNGESESIEGTNALALGSGVWEAELLRHHFSPQVRKEVLDIDKAIQGLYR